MVAASAAYLSLGFTLGAIFGGANRNFFFSGIFLALAACIRPNYLYVLPVNFIFIFRANSKLLKNNKSIIKSLFFRFVHFNIGFFTVIFFVFIPYFFLKNGISVLIDALFAIANFKTSFHASELFYHQLISDRTFSFYSCLYFGCVVLLKNIIFGEVAYDSFFKNVGLLSIFSISFINFSLFCTHYWSHNSIMFVPYAIPVFLLFFIRFVKQTSKGGFNVKERSFYKKIYIACALILLATPLCLGIQRFGRIILKGEKPNFEINDRGIDHELLNFLIQQKKSFYVHFSPIYHSLLHESRIGDGHPIMLKYVLDGVRVGPVGEIYLFSDEVFKSPCDSLLQSRKDLIILDKNFSSHRDRLISCLRLDKSRYKEIHIEGLTKYDIFSRF